jgi:hypothetical protein
LGVIKRWLERADADDIWKKLKTALPAGYAVTPGQFIGEVIRLRLYAQGVEDMLPDETGVTVAAEGMIMGNVIRGDVSVAAELGALLGKHFARRGAASRQEGAGRTWFMWTLSESFKLTCGRPLDTVVARLTRDRLWQR